MFGANAMWGLMSPVAKFAMACGTVSPFAITQLRVFGAAVLFWGASFFQKREHVSSRDMRRLFCASMFVYPRIWFEEINRAFEEIGVFCLQMN